MFSKMKSGIAFKESVFLKIKANPRGPVVATKQNCTSIDRQSQVCILCGQKIPNLLIQCRCWPTGLDEKQWPQCQENGSNVVYLGRKGGKQKEGKKFLTGERLKM